MDLYKATLHHSLNTIERWFTEVLGIYTSMLNECNYYVDHYFIGMKRWLKDYSRADKIRVTFESEDLTSVVTDQEIAALK